MKKCLKILLGIIKTVVTVFFIVFLMMVVVQKFSNNNLSVAGIRLFTVVSESMVPEYNIGDVLLIQQKDVSEIKIGDDLCYQGLVDDYAGKVITHRVREIHPADNGLEFVTEGIANVMTDPVVNQNQVLGVVSYKTKLLSAVSKLAYNEKTFIICIFIPIVVLLIYWFYNFFKEISHKLDDKADKILSSTDDDYKAIKELDKLKEEIEKKKKERK